LFEKTLGGIQDQEVQRQLKRNWATLFPSHLHEVMVEARTNQVQQGKAKCPG